MTAESSVSGSQHTPAIQLGSEDAIESRGQDGTGRRSASLLLAVAVVLVALNLRPAITSVGTVLGEARDDLGASATWAGVLTTLPGLCFAVAGLAAPWLARRAGLAAAVGLALTVLAAGLVLRVLDGPLVVLGGTLVATAGIALANVLVPVVVKGSFPARVGLMTGIYTAALQGGGALGSALTPPLAGTFGGWRAALAGWALLAAVALAGWLLATRGGRLRPASTGSAPPGSAPRRSLLRSPLAWVVTLFFGLQALLAYVVMGWLPEVLVDAGVSRTDAGLLLGLVSMLAVPISLVVPPLAARGGSQSGWIVGLGAFALASLVGLLVAPGAAPLLWTVLLGIGMSVFSLALTTIALRARTGEDTAALSGMAQGLGYLLAALGPFLFGFLHDLTGGWTVPFGMLIAAMLVQLVAGWVAGRPRYV
ncbi:MFS transporter, CP family, cyanate transporter [Amycolatopsis arida]|uniref:MFS transporter, CP family, cyanate transporter n=1 Tax=Amycolatopsis arida TaxID=587909 RepID=A0A1I5KKB2_9PSEU|nr:MFS transporter [Amycolatopsis arida]TDX97088.1 CP family cyanate transporter-like MFS transporter [Amycolatopsis arida]SFO85422.1 MFS transporter, CP family, cyanate transporter [Amycolatopsis arida]